MKAESLVGRVVVLKLKTAGFKLRTRQTRLDVRSNLADRIYQTGRELLEREIDGTRFRLLGVGMSDLVESGEADQADLLDPIAGRRARAEVAMDEVRARFGADHLALGLTFEARESRRDKSG